ncbi:MAG: RHS repeat-associated core domain-containing protein [Pirellulaceae bacterium]
MGWARFYAAQLGRFCSRDPIGYRGSRYNLCQQSDGNPTTFTDAHGLGVLITANCGLIRHPEMAIWETCEYECIEDTSVPRQTIPKGGTDDGYLPSPITFRWRITIKRWKCCEPTLQLVDHPYTSVPPPISDCSKRECLEQFKEARDKWITSCNGLIAPPLKLACKNSAKVWYLAVIPKCNYCERD